MNNDKLLNKHNAKLVNRCNNLIQQIKELARYNKSLKYIAKNPHRKPKLIAIIDETRQQVESISNILSDMNRAYSYYHKSVKG